MTVFIEGDLQMTIDGSEVVSIRKFDDASHGLSHCMKGVDLILELNDRYLFIEFKDPQSPGAPSQSAEEYLKRFKSGELDEELKYKYRAHFCKSGSVD